MSVGLVLPGGVMERMRGKRMWLAAVLVAFAIFGVWFATFRASSEEGGYVILGNLALRGQVRLFQDEIVGERLPLPF